MFVLLPGYLKMCRNTFASVITRVLREAVILAGQPACWILRCIKRQDLATRPLAGERDLPSGACPQVTG